VRGRKAIGQSVIEARKLAGIERGNAMSGCAWNAIAGQHDAIILISADDESALGIDHGGGGGIVILGQKFGDVAPLTVPLGPHRPARAVFDGELGSYFPTVLHEKIDRSGHVGRVGFRAKFGIGVEVSKCGVGDRQARCVGIAGVIEAEIAILIDCGAGAGGGALNKIVLS
jgi:hypothetical protein